MIYYVTICCKDNQDGVRQFYVGRRLVFLILLMKFLQKLDKKLDSRQQSSWNCKLLFITCGVKMYMNKIAGSFRGYYRNTLGLATLPAIQQWEIK